MKKEINLQDSNASKNSLFTLSKIPGSNSNKFIKLDDIYCKINKIKQNPKPLPRVKRKYSDKITKKKDFNSKLKNFIKQSNSNSVASQINSSSILKKENSLSSAKQTQIFPISNKSKNLNISKKNQIKNYVISCDNNLYSNSNSIEHNFFKTQSEEFNNSIESFNNTCLKSIIKDNNDSIKKEVSSNFDEIDLRIDVDIIGNKTDDNIKNSTIKNKNINLFNENNLNSFNEDFVNNPCNIFSSFSNKIDNSKQIVPIINNEETKSIIANNVNYNFKTQKKINIINLKNHNENKAFSINSQNCKNFQLQSKAIQRNLKGCKDNKLKRKHCSATQLNTCNTLKIDKNIHFISENKNNENKHLILIKNKTANKIPHFEKGKNKVNSNIPNCNIYLQTAPESRSIYSINHGKLNIKSVRQSNSNERFKRNFPIDDNHFKIRKNLKGSKSQNPRLLKINLYFDSSSNENLEYLLSNEKKHEKSNKKNKVKIIDENESNVEIKNYETYNNNFKNFTYNDYLELGFNEKKSSKSFENNSTKSIFYKNQSNKFLIHLLNSNDSSYSEKFICILNKFKLYLEKLIIFISINEDSSDNFSIFKNISNNILNASLSNNQLNYFDLIYEYCLESNIKPADLKVNDLIKNLEKNIKFQFEDVLLGISPIILDCNIIRQNFLESYSKSRKNVLPMMLPSNSILEKNLNLILEKSENRIEQIKVVFQEMQDNLIEINQLLVNEFGENLTKKLEEFRTQDFNLIINNISNLNFTETSNILVSNKIDKRKSEMLEDNLSKQTKFKSEKIPRLSKVIEIDLTNNNNNNTFIKKNKTLPDHRKSLKEILECEVNLKEEDFITEEKIKYKNNDNKNYVYKNSKNIKNQNEIKRFGVLNDNGEIKSNLKRQSEKQESFSKEKANEKNYLKIETTLHKSKTGKEDEIHKSNPIKISDTIVKSFKNNSNKRPTKPSNDSLNKKNKKIPKIENLEFKLFNNINQTTKFPFETKKKKIINLTLIPNKSLFLKSYAENKENDKKSINKKKLKNIKFNSKLDSSIKKIEKQESLKDTISIENLEGIEKCKKEAIEEINHQINSSETLNNSKSKNIKNMNLDNQNLNIDKLNLDKFNIITINNYNTNNIIENKNFVNINLNLNPIVENIFIEENPFNNKNQNISIESFYYSKSDKNVSLFDSADFKSRNCKKKIIFNSFPKAYFAYFNYTQLVGQRKSKIEKFKKMNNNFEHKNSIFSKTSLEESDLMASIDEFESNEKVHLNIPTSTINFAYMPICGSKIIRRHSSFSKVLEMFNYKRFFNFKKKSSLLSSTQSPNINKMNHNSINQNIKSNYYHPDERFQNNQRKIIEYDFNNVEKDLIENKNHNPKNEKTFKDFADIKNFKNKKIEINESNNISEINSSALDLSLSASEICNDDVFNCCCEKIELKERLSLIKFKHKSLLINKRFEQSKKIFIPKKNRSRSVVNLKIVNNKKQTVDIY